MLLDDLEREVVAGEGELDQDDAEGEQAAEAVDGTAREVDPALLALAAAQGQSRRRDRCDESEGEGGAAEASRHSSFFGGVNFDGHLVVSVSGSPAKTPSSRPGR